MTGTCVWWNRKGYGFILREDGADVFVHYTNLEGSLRNLKAKDRVSFSVTQTDCGLKAVNVRKVE